VSEEAFWSVVADCIADYQESNPQLADRFEEFDLFVERFPLSCLKPAPVAGQPQMVDLDDPASALQLAGTLENRSPGTGDTRLSGSAPAATARSLTRG